MQIRNNLQSYGITSRFLHWAMAIAVIAMLWFGSWMTDLPMGSDKFRLYGIHKAIGALILCAALLRLIWRWMNIQPALPENMPKHQRLAAHAGHLALYALLFLMPLSGWVMSSAAGFPVSVFGWFTLPDLIAPNKPLQELAKEVHEWMASALIALIVVHVAAALYHHFIRKDTILRRMLPW